MATDAALRGDDATFTQYATALNGPADSNTVDLVAAITSAYGPEVGTAFDGLWRSENHIPQFVAYTQAVATGDEAAKAAASAPIAVIVHEQVPVEDLSLAELRRIFLGERQFWSKELMITLLTPPHGSPERKVLLRKIYGEQNEVRYQRHWINKLFSDGAQGGPKITGSPEMSASLARVIPGAIALVPADDIPEGVKVLRIDGKRPGEKGYPLVS